MIVKLHPPGSKATVEVADDDAERFLSQGWREQDEPKRRAPAKPKRKPSKPPPSEPKE